jgi:AraC-like DNA-binding protein
VQGGDGQVAGFREGQGMFHGLPIADFADEDHIGGLTQGIFQRRMEAAGINPHLALVDDALLVLVNIFDGIFDGDDMAKEFVEKFKALIDEKMGDSGLNVEDLGKDMGLSRVQLYRKIKSLTNYSPNELLRIARLKKAASLLASSDMTVSEIGYEVGFSSPSYFAKCYKELFGESPTDLLKRKR